MDGARGGDRWGRKGAMDGARGIDRWGGRARDRWTARGMDSDIRAGGMGRRAGG
jgi:hypothetical protein